MVHRCVQWWNCISISAKLNYVWSRKYWNALDRKKREKKNSFPRWNDFHVTLGKSRTSKFQSETRASAILVQIAFEESSERKPGQEKWIINPDVIDFFGATRKFGKFICLVFPFIESESVEFRVSIFSQFPPIYFSLPRPLDYSPPLPGRAR